MNLGVLISLLTSVFVTMLVLLVAFATRKQRKAALEQERRRRMVDHKMNARLLRLNL